MDYRPSWKDRFIEARYNDLYSTKRQDKMYYFNFRYTDFHKLARFLIQQSESLVSVRLHTNHDWYVSHRNNFGVTVTQVFRTGE